MYFKIILLYNISVETLVSKAIEEYVENYSSPVSSLLEELEKETYEIMDEPEMLSGQVECRLLQLLIRISDTKKVVELGTFTGYSALMMAEALPDKGELITCEISLEKIQFAQRYFNLSPHGRKIKLMQEPARETLRKISSNSTDFVFIDADKPSYPHYYMESYRIVKNGGLIVADNSLWSGRVLDPKDDDSRAIAEFNDMVKTDDRVEKVLLTIRDGVYLIRKKH